MKNDEISNQKNEPQAANTKNNSESVNVVDRTATLLCDGFKRELTVDFSITKDSPKTMAPAASTPVIDTSTARLQTEWQDEIIIFTPLVDQQMILPEASNFLSVETFLKMCNLKHVNEERPNAVAMSPTNTIPFIKVDKNVVGGLEAIIQFVNTKNISLIEKLDPDQKVNLKAFIALILYKLYLVELYMCWKHEETYKTVTRIKNGSVYPWPLNWIHNITQRYHINKILNSFDWKEKTLNEVLFEFEICCEALSQRLAGKAHFFDEGDTELDACVFGHLFSILITPLPGNHLANTVKAYPNLIKLINRMKKVYF